MFENPDRKEPILLNNLSRGSSRTRQKCSICSESKSGACVQCIWPKCYTYLHVTCAQYSSLVPQTLAGKSGFVCNKHTSEVNDGAPDLGSCVKVKWSKREIYDARIIGYTTVPQYRVIFDNGTTNTVTEEFIYSLNEPLPRRVKDKLKVCTTIHQCCAR
uniref:PHD-type domain-containing protein n=1 Tax=Amphimedon queenslandica TaxID=400682 RepID=A0A1X7UAL9_AMPQE